MLLAFSVAPSVAADDTGSVHEAVADAIEIVRASGLPNSTDAMFTTLEGEWDECMDVVRRATEAVGRHGTRVSLVRGHILVRGPGRVGLTAVRAMAAVAGMPRADLVLFVTSADRPFTEKLLIVAKSLSKS